MSMPAFPAAFRAAVAPHLMQEIEAAPDHHQTIAFLMGPDLLAKIDGAGVAWNCPGVIDTVRHAMEQGRYDRQVSAWCAWMDGRSEAHLMTQRLAGESDTAYQGRMVALLLQERSQGGRALPSRESVAAELDALMDGRLPDPWGGTPPEGLDAFAAEFAKADRGGNLRASFTGGPRQQQARATEADVAAEIEKLMGPTS